MQQKNIKCDYYVIDFETANASPTSACSIGIIGVKNGKIVVEDYHLINPQEPFLPFNILIHHIKEEDVIDADTFDVLWDKIKHYFDHTIVFSHFSGFDFNVLKALLEKYEIQKPIFRFGCTVKVSRLVWNDSEVPNHKLDTMAQYLGVEFNHHHALSDASVCVDILNRALKITQEEDIVSFYTNLNLRFGYMGPKRFYDTYQLKMRTKKNRPKVHNPELLDKVIVLSGKPEKMKRNDLVDLIVANGGYVDSIVDIKCDYFVMLSNFKEDKLNQVHRLLQAGAEIKVLNEQQLMELIKL